MLEATVQDFRYALRKLRLSPAFTVPAVLILGLGIGATSVLFSVLQPIVLEPLPFDQPERLARLYHWSDEWARVPSSPVHFATFTDDAESLESLAAYRYRSATVAGPAGPERMLGVVTLGPFFDLLGVSATVGRGPAVSDHDPAQPPVVVLSHGASQRLLDPGRDSLGQSVKIDGEVQTVVGVAPPGFRFPDREVEFWLPARGPILEASSSILPILVRLADGVTHAEAAAELSLISQRLADQNPEIGLGEVLLQPLRDSIVETVKKPLFLLMGVVVLVLLIACANVANLLLARAVGRRHEIAVRRALGAGRSRLLRGLFAESLVLAALGGLTGLAIAVLGLRSLLAWLAGQLPRGGEVALDGTVLALTLGTSLAASLLFGLAPCWSLVRTGGASEVWRGISDGGRMGRRLFPQQLLAIVQTALAVLLLVGAGLLLRSLAKTLEVDPGFHSADGFSFSVRMHGLDSDDPEAPLRFHDQLQERFADVAGVEQVARASFLPLNHRTGWASSIHVRGRVEDQGVFLYRLVSTHYFEVLGSQRLEGRLFEDADRAGRKVVVINDSMARRLWPDGDALGAVITLGSPQSPLIAEATVVGVVRDARDLDLGKPARPVLYAPHHLVPWYDRFEYVVRSPVAPAGLVPELRRQLQKLDPEIPLFGVRTLEERIADNVAGSRALALLLGGFAGLALVLAALGLFSLSTYLVAQRSRELAIRMALGATARRIRRLVLRQGLVQVLIGLTVGLVGSVGLSRLVESLLFGVTPQDPITLAATGLVLLVTMIAACLPSAQRAARIAPVELLRED